MNNLLHEPKPLNDLLLLHRASKPGALMALQTPGLSLLVSARLGAQRKARREDQVLLRGNKSKPEPRLWKKRQGWRRDPGGRRNSDSNTEAIFTVALSDGEVNQVGQSAAISSESKEERKFCHVDTSLNIQPGSQLACHLGGLVTTSCSSDASSRLLQSPLASYQPRRSVMK